jgi:HK97 gp10 family phage protein
MARRNVSLEIDGISEVIGVIDDVLDDALGKLDDAAKSGAEIVLDAAEQIVKVRTGELKRSLDLKKEGGGKTKKVWNVVSKGESEGGVRYGLFVERGTSKTPAQPYLGPASDNNEDKVKNKIIQVISQGIT